MENSKANTNRYLKLMLWAKKRYTVNGIITLTVGFTKAEYLRIEEIAWIKYMA